jgi:hypothetical protein
MVKAKHRKCDTVMALWFAELRAREVTVGAKGHRPSFLKNGFLSERDKGKQMVVNLDDYFTAKQEYTWI